MSAFELVPETLQAPEQAAAAEGELLAAVARAVSGSSADTGRADSGEALTVLLLRLAAEARARSNDARAHASAVRAAASTYVATDLRVMGR